MLLKLINGSYLKNVDLVVFELHQHCKVSQMITAAIRSSAGVILSFAASL